MAAFSRLIRSVTAAIFALALVPLATGTPKTEPASPRPEVGALSNGANPTDHHCSASIVQSPRGNIIITAAHCVAGKSKVFFTPGYHNGQTPHGTWQSSSIHVSSGWSSSHDISNAGSPFDFAFIVLRPRSDGKNVAEVTGASLTLKTDIALPVKVQVIGYPSPGNAKYQDEPYLCDSTTSADGDFMTLQCTGIPNGFSGGPWIVNSRQVIGVIGGKGQSLPDADPHNYSVRFGERVQALYSTAVAAAAGPVEPAAGYPLGDGGTWKHADLITCGLFDRLSVGYDMLVKWSDGEVTLYLGSSDKNPRDNAPFRGERQLAKPGSIWRNAKAIGTVGQGIVVVWVDGEVSYYDDVGNGGFSRETQLKAPNGLWRDHASLVSGVGNDLVVVWSDGEVSKYAAIASRALGAETQLAAPGGVWRYAVSISSGQWTSQLGDLLVRWVDGELSIYSDVVNGGLTRELQIYPPNELWTHATVVAGHKHDIIVRWSDGEVSFYPRVTNSLGQELQLVAPG